MFLSLFSFNVLFSFFILEYHKRDYYSRFSHNNQIPSVLRGAKLGLSSNISTKEKYHIVTEIMTQIGSLMQIQLLCKIILRFQIQFSWGSFFQEFLVVWGFCQGFWGSTTDLRKSRVILLLRRIGLCQCKYAKDKIKIQLYSKLIYCFKVTFNSASWAQEIVG